MKITMTRNAIVNGKPAYVDDELSVKDKTARELIGMKKAEEFDPKAKKAKPGNKAE